jgi:hypothetical protein
MSIHSAEDKVSAKNAERRQYRRYRFTGDKVLVFRHTDKKVGWITDMSRGGLSYEYIPTSESKSEKEVIDIFAFGKTRFFMPGLSCKRIYDRNEKATSGSHSPVKFKRCGLKCSLSDRQASRLTALFLNRWREDEP